MLLLQSVECVEKFLLNIFTALEELHVVKKQHIYRAVFVAEIRKAFFGQIVYVFIKEFLSGEIADGKRGVSFFKLISYCLHQVGFAKS
jgi:hypothetical protein